MIPVTAGMRMIARAPRNSADTRANNGEGLAYNNAASFWFAVYISLDNQVSLAGTAAQRHSSAHGRTLKIQ